MGNIASAALAIAMLAAFLLAWGGAMLLRRRADRSKGLLMLVMAAVLVANVLIWAF